MANEPKRIIDIGAGYGKYGVLTRLYLESNCYKKNKCELTIDAIEPYDQYLTNTKHYYNDIFNFNAIDIQDTIVGYDMVFFFDVIEHIEKKKALSFLKHLIANNKYILISTPH